MTVYYNPAKPSDSLLEIGGKGFGAWLLGGGMALVMFALIFALIARSRFKEK